MFSSFSRRRIAVLLALTCLLLIAIDRAGDNAAISKVRRGFAVAVHPFEVASRVVARPFERAWNGVRHYDEVLRENEALRDQVSAQAGAAVEYVAAQLQLDDLKRLTGLNASSRYGVAYASVIGEAPSNFQNTVEINLGANVGLKVGMPVTDGRGVVGRIRMVKDTSSVVLLLTDPSYRVQSELLMAANEIDQPSTDDPVTGDSTVTAGGTLGTGPIGTSPEVGGPDGSSPGTLPAGTDVPVTTPDTTLGSEPSPGSTVGTGVIDTTTTTTTTIVPDVVRETGIVEGQSADRPLRLRFVDIASTSRSVRPGAIVLTAGGGSSLAPPGLPIGEVTKVELGNSGGDAVIEVEPYARLNQLKFVAVVLYVPNPDAAGT